MYGPITYGWHIIARQCRPACVDLVLTFVLVVYYGSPVYASKRDIWPPLSKVTDFEDAQRFLDEPLAQPSGTGPVGEEASSDATTSQPKDELEYSIPDFTGQLELENELYHPLHHGRIIRILDIQPGKGDDLVTCDFHYIDLHKLHEKYEALSYVWGENSSSFSFNLSSETKPTVTCNGHAIEVTPNLSDALRDIRSATETKSLWVDALCINQDDNSERSHQVTLMSSIYSAASKVVIWIGEQDYRRGYVDERKGMLVSYPDGFEDVRPQRAFGAVCDIVNRWRRGKDEKEKGVDFSTCSPDDRDQRVTLTTFQETLEIAKRYKNSDAMQDALDYKFSPNYPDDEPVEDLGIDSPPDAAKNSQFWISLCDLFDRSWFWRVWTIQEAVLAQKAIVKWAGTEIDWRWIGTAAAILRTTYRRVCDELQMSGVYNAYLLFRMSRLSDLPSPQLSFLQLLRLTRQFEVTDPRDRVYGLLGMTTKDNVPAKGNFFLHPDYKITETELWTRVAWKSIEDTGSLSILSSIQYTTTQHDVGSEATYRMLHDVPTDIPSWVPHWQTAYRSTLAAWDIQESFSASKGLTLKPQLFKSSKSSILRVEGLNIGTVGLAGSYMWHDVDTSFLLSSHMGAFLAAEAGLSLLARTYTAGRNEYGSLSDAANTQALRDLAAYILTLHKKWDPTTGYQGYDELNLRSEFSTRYGPRESKNFQPIFDKHVGLKEKLEEIANEGGDAERFRATAVATCERRRSFITMNGFLGLGPDNLVEGDVLVVLTGADVPFLLRPVEQGKEVETMASNDPHNIRLGQYYIVGEVYVKGLMEGQAVTAVEKGSPLMGNVPTKIILEEIMKAAEDAKAKDGTAASLPAEGVDGEEDLTEVKPTLETFDIL